MVTMKDLQRLVRVENPCDLGLQLNIDETSIKVIKANYPNDRSEQLYEVFTLYLDQTEEPSWLQVVAALRSIGKINCAKTIMDEFGIRTPNVGSGIIAASLQLSVMLVKLLIQLLVLFPWFILGNVLSSQVRIYSACGVIFCSPLCK